MRELGSAAEEGAIDAVSVASDGGAPARVGSVEGPRGRSPAPRGPGASEATISVEEAGGSVPAGPTWQTEHTIISSSPSGSVSGPDEAAMWAGCLDMWWSS
jgi:hypothetical protein